MTLRPDMECSLEAVGEPFGSREMTSGAVVVTVGGMTDPTSLPNFTPFEPAGTPNGAAHSTTPARDRVLASLQALGIPATVDGDGDLEFTITDEEGNTTTLFARVAEVQAEAPVPAALVRFFGQWQLQEPVSPDRNERIARCNDLTMQVNLVKLTLVQESLVVSVEHVILPNTDLDVLTMLSINHLLAGVGIFYQSWTTGDGAETPGVEHAEGGPQDGA